MKEKSQFAIENGTIYTPLKIIEDGVLLVRDGKIVELGTKSQVKIPEGFNKVDAQGLIICPGFLDLQVNGGGGVFLTENSTYDDVCVMARAHAKFGTTGMLPTILTSEKNNICKALKAVSEAVFKGTGGATILGSHLEGPFINEKKKGAHEVKFIRPPSIDDFELFYQASEGTMKILTLAPEIEGSLSLIKYAKDRGVFLSIGHSVATYVQVCNAVEAGLSLATHIFNAMEGLGSREPGTVGAILANDKIKTGLIADCIHVHPMSMKIVIKSKGIKNVFLVTDAMPPIGTDLESFKLYDKTIYVKGGGCYAADGTLAGSALTMNIAVKNIHQQVGIPLNYAIAMATKVPAKAIGLSDRKGSLAVGKDADIVICDRGMRIFKVFAEGRMVYEAK